MPLPHRPALRCHLDLRPLNAQRRHFLLRDQLRLSPWDLRLVADEVHWLEFFDGRHTLAEIQSAVSRQMGQPVSLDLLGRLLEQLEAGLFLDGPLFQQQLHDPIRPPACIGVYEPDPVALRHQLKSLFLRADGPGASAAVGRAPPWRALLVPHMDYARGGNVYARTFRTLLERPPSQTIVILATSHYSRHRLTLTRKSFRTPLGIVETDTAVIDRLVAAYGNGLFDDEALAHFPEHSVELEVVLLQYLSEMMPRRRPFRIVPLVVGSIFDCVRQGLQPLDAPDIRRMVAALQEVDRTAQEPITYLISGDLAHLGPKFGDGTLSDWTLRHSANQDRRLLRKTEEADPDGYFGIIQQEQDERRICGLSPTYLALAALRPSRGQMLAWEQHVAPDRHESVSFAGVGFEA